MRTRLWLSLNIRILKVVRCQHKSTYLRGSKSEMRYKIDLFLLAIVKDVNSFHEIIFNILIL